MREFLEKNHKDDIDRDIFANLRTLWPGAEDEQIEARLMDEKPSWEKGVYQLLVQYRAKHSEDYDEDEERALVAEREKRRKASTKRGLNASGGSHLSEDAGASSPTVRTRWWSPSGRRSGPATPTLDFNDRGGEGCTIM